MKRLSLLMLLALAAVVITASTAEAQNIASMRNSLANRSMSGDHVQITEDSYTTAAISEIEGSARVNSINGYRVLIFSDNGQYAGDNANSVLDGFRRRFPHINAYLVYESPYFKVSVGDCTTMEEAQMLMAELIEFYPRAFPRRESISLTNLSNVRADERVQRDSLEHKH